MSIKVMNWVWGSSAQKGSALLLLLAVADHAHDDGAGAYPSIQTLAAKSRLTPRAVQGILNRLEAAGELIIQRRTGPHQVNVYTVPMMLRSEAPATDTDLPIGANGGGPEPAVPEGDGENFSPSGGDGEFTMKSFHDEKNTLGMAMRISPKPSLEPSGVTTSFTAVKDVAAPDKIGPANSRSKEIFKPPDWFEPLTRLEGYRRIDHSRFVSVLEKTCQEGRVSPAAVVESFAGYYQLNRFKHGWSDPVKALRNTLAREIAKVNGTNRSPPRSLHQKRMEGEKDLPPLRPVKYL